MKILIFEYSSVCLETNLLSEGFNMLKGLLNDLDSLSYFNIDYLINESLEITHLNHSNPIYIKQNLCKWLEDNCNKYDYCMFIAPEDNHIQYHITKILEDNEVNVIGCDSSSSYVCSSKFLTYKKVSSDILKIKTRKMNVKNLNHNNIKKIFKKKDYIIKPDDKTSSDLIYHVKNEEQLNRIKKEYVKNNIANCLLQEYIDGTPVSVSLICNGDEICCLSTNSQIIQSTNEKIEYIGCETPINHPMEKELFEISGQIVKDIPGLKGFIGIDYIIRKNKIYFVEINSRITTPYIVLQEKCNENLTKTIIDLVINNKKNKLTFKEKGRFMKLEGKI